MHSSVPNDQWISPLALRNSAIIIVFIWLLYQSFKYIYKQLKFVNRLNKLPGIRISPFTFYMGNIGCIFAFPNSDIIYRYFGLLQGLTKLFDGMFILWMSYQPFVFVYKADIAEKILANNINTEKAFQYSTLKPWLNQGLLISGGNKWNQRRKLLTPAFHFNILEEFLPIMVEQANVLIQVIKEQNKKFQYLDVIPLMTNAALDVISETAMGVKIGSQQYQNQNYVNAISRISQCVIKRFIFPWLQNDFIYFNLIPEGSHHRSDLNLVHAFTMDIIKKRKNQMSSKNQTAIESNKSKHRLTFMDLLIEQHWKQPNQFTELDIREEVDTFMFEGHDTTAMSMIWTLYLLGNHIDIQDRVQQEIDLLKETLEDDCPSWTMNQLRQMKFLEACIKESLRLFPSVPIIGRKTSADIQIECDVIVPKGSTLMLFLYEIQRDPKYFFKPDHFIPDRFIEGSEYYQGRINPYAFVPFSAGPRNCIGQKFALLEEKIMLATLLSEFKVKSEQPIGKIEALPSLILRPKSSVKIQFEPR